MVVTGSIARVGSGVGAVDVSSCVGVSSWVGVGSCASVGSCAGVGSCAVVSSCAVVGSCGECSTVEALGFLEVALGFETVGVGEVITDLLLVLRVGRGAISLSGMLFTAVASASQVSFAPA